MRLDEDYLRELELSSHFALLRARDGLPATKLADAVPQPRPIAPIPVQMAAPVVLRQAKAPAAPPTVDSARAVRIAQLGWDEIETEVRSCKACELCAQRKQAVPGVGARNAPWLFVGEGPGAEEDASGEPFVGAAGKLLDQMLAATGLLRGREVYIANVVKCRPPGNRTPTLNEAAACAPFLDRQIELIQPKIIVALGKTAVVRLTGSDDSMASLRGKRLSYLGIPVVATYHPSYLLRNLPEKLKAWEDMLLAKRVLAETMAPVKTL